MIKVCFFLFSGRLSISKYIRASGQTGGRLRQKVKGEPDPGQHRGPLGRRPQQEDHCLL